jgi:predicted peptidase
MNHAALLLVCAAAAAMALEPSPDAAALAEAREFKSAEGTLPWRLVSPADPEPGARYPLVLVLHGAGERGADNAAQLRNPVLRAFLAPAARAEFPCYIAAPQCPPDEKWTGVNWQKTPHDPQTAAPTRAMKLVLALLDSLLAELPVDASRIYLTGPSMGGSGTWDLITRFPSRFAGAVPICGGADAAQGHRAAAVPVWCFQGGKDEVVKPELSRRMIEALRAAGGEPRYTEFADGGHHIAARVWQDPEVMRWLFAQRRGGNP